MMPTLDVDFEVWKALTAMRRSEADGYNDVLRRLLKLDAAEPEPMPRPPSHPIIQGLTRPWLIKGIVVPHGSEMRMTYKGVTYTATVKNGEMEFPDGRTFTTPSKAAGAITKTMVNGWLMWECRLPNSSSWVPLDALRKRRVEI